MQPEVRPPLQSLEHQSPFESQHDLKTTSATIKQLLAGGTPDWVRFPNDYRSMVREQQLADKEMSDEMVEEYRMEDQEVLTNKPARMVNLIYTRSFIKILRDNGVKCFTIDNGFPPQTVGLWAYVPNTDRVRYICYLQVPCQYEWSVLRLDRHHLPNGEAYRGWRTVLSELIKKGILTEVKAHEIFGAPMPNDRSARYLRTLWELRNGRRYEDAESVTAEM